MKNKLDKWGYGYTDWTRNGVRITYIPTTAAERLAEIMIREYGLDVQIDCVSFAIFVTAFNDIDGFDSMPWGERAKELREKYGVDVSDRTLRSWCSRLISSNIVFKERIYTCWKTEIIDGEKRRTQVDREETSQYYDRRSELVQKYTMENLLAGMGKEEARKNAWKTAYCALWDEFHCCYYYCKSFLFSSFSNKGMMLDVYELAREIVGKEETDG